MTRGLLTGITLMALAFPSPGDAQTYRRPFSADRYVTAHFDTNGPGGGVADYTCGDRTYDGHTGTDFGLVVGTPILAAAPGRVINVFTGCPDVGYNCSPCGSLCGNQIRLQHPDGSQTVHCHMQSGGMRVAVGDTVTCGQVIGHSASSGCSTGPHLHFGYHPSASSAADDPFRGACGGPISLWTNQRAYPSTPGPECACTASAETCNGRDDDCDGRTDEALTRSCTTACGSGNEACSAGAWGTCSAPAPGTEGCNGRDDDCDGSVDEGDVCGRQMLRQQAGVYAAPRTTDVNGDGRADLCARGGAGVRCWIATPSGWPEEWAPVPWSDDTGWNDLPNYATLRMGDLNADGLADVCGRADSGVVCALSNGSGFDEVTRWQDELTDAAGWDTPPRYTTLRLADVDADGRDDLCARDADGFGCWLSDGASFGRHIEGPAWSDADGWDATKLYGTIRTGDVDGDGRDDVCARSTAGMECWLSDGDSLSTRVEGPAWAGGDWGDASRWSTIRLLDYDGDGRADLCARVGDGIGCARSEGSRFAAVETAIALGGGWEDPSNYATLRVGDFDGDGKDDLCLRSNMGVFCARWDGASFQTVDGHEWSDDVGWNSPRFYQTIRLADFDGDGRDDLCARAAAGWRCHRSEGDAFAAEAVVLDELTDAGNWDEPEYWSTILSAGRACVAAAETCNGRDDDCDGAVDEGLECGAPRDAGAGSADAAAAADGGTREGVDGVSGGCGCRAHGRGDATLPGLLLALVFVRHRRR